MPPTETINNHYRVLIHRVTNIYLTKTCRKDDNFFLDQILKPAGRAKENPKEKLPWINIRLVLRHDAFFSVVYYIKLFNCVIAVI